MEIRIRQNEGAMAQPNLSIDTEWDVKLQHGVWVIKNQTLKHESALYTTIINCLFTDKRLPDGQEIPDGSTDRRGWWGHSVKLDGEFEFGSYLWLLVRAPLTDDTEVKAKDYVLLALEPLLKQQVIANIDVNISADKAMGKLQIDIKAFSASNGATIAQKFNIWWKQTI